MGGDASANVGGLFLLLGVSLLAGFGAHLVFRRHRVSDIGILLVVGLILGPVLGLVDAAPLAPAMVALAPLGLAIVLFEGGLELAWTDLRRHAVRAFAGSIAVWGLTVLAVALVAGAFLGLSPVLAALFALTIAATGILAVIPLLQELDAPASARVTLTVETSVGDLLSVVAVAAIAGVFASGASPWAGAAALGVDFLVGASVGAIAGVLAARVLHHVENEKHGYALLLALLLLAYAVAERIGGSGFLAALTLGLFAGNARDLMALGGIRRLAPPARAMRLHQNHIIFLLRSVYFVWLGLSIPTTALTPVLALVGVALTVAMVAARWLAIVATQPPTEDRALLVAVMPRGLAAAILAGVPAALGIPGTEMFVAWAFAAILGADVATTLGLWWRARKGAATAEPATAQPEPR